MNQSCIYKKRKQQRHKLPNNINKNIKMFILGKLKKNRFVRIGTGSHTTDTQKK